MKYVGGQILGRYELLLPIASGGMAEVWAARLRGSYGFQKIVAIKTIRPNAIDDTRMHEMFLEEAALASQIHHPNVVETLELGDHEGTLYLVMDWVDGESLSALIKQATPRGGIPLPVAVNLIGQACKGLHAAHDLRDESGALLGVVHRDISPPNVLVTYSGNAKLADFGIAKAMSRSSTLTNDGELKGKFSYVAPEQVRGQDVDRRADIFSMGILLYILTTGRHPFPGNHPAEILQNICSSKAAIRPSDVIDGYPLELEDVVLKALSKAPDDRYATANEMLAALEGAMPQSMDGSFEVKVAAYMHELFGERSRDRKAQLRLAQELADQSPSVQMRAVGSPSIGSLGAIAIDRKDSHSSGATAAPTKDIVVDIAMKDSFIEYPRRARFGKFSKLMAALVAVAALLFVVSRTRSRYLGRDVAATSPVPSPLVLEPPMQPLAPLPLASSAPAASAAIDVLQEDAKQPRKGAAGVSRPAGPSRAPAAPVSTPIATAKSPPPSPAEHPPAAARATSNPNPWDNRF